jgi:signal peptidase II
LRKLFLVTAFLSFLADRVTKFLAFKYLIYRPVSVIPGFFSLKFAENKGAAFSFLSNGNEMLRFLFLILVPFGVVAYILYYVFRKELSFRLSLALGLICGGALGNLYDRILSGKVVDFFDFYFKAYHYPTFNVADVCVFLGTLIVLIPRKRALR